MKSDHQQRVEEFMTKIMGLKVPQWPTLPHGREELVYLARLIMEEAMETVEALGVRMYVEADYDMHLEFDEIEFIAREQPDLSKVADGCADTIYVSTFTLSYCGISDLPLQEEIDKSNLSKAGGYRDCTGKWVKPVTYQPADVWGVLLKQLNGRGELEEFHGE